MTLHLLNVLKLTLSLVLFSVLMLNLSACGNAHDKNDGDPFDDNRKAGLEAFNKVTSSSAFPKLGDKREIRYSSYYDLSSSVVCEYRVHAREEVLLSSPAFVHIRYNRTSSPHYDNDPSCPNTKPGFKIQGEERFTGDEFIEYHQDAFRAWTDPVTYMSINVENVASAKVIESTEVTHMGTRAQRLKMEIKSKRGRRFERVTYISLEYKFLAVIESSLINDAGNIVTRFETSQFRLNSGTLRYP